MNFDKLDNYINTTIFIEEKKEDKTLFNEFYCTHCNKNTMTEDDLGYECYNCGYIRDPKIIDQGAEWRYYGINDTRGYNPTRTGNIINPLLSNFL